VEGIDVGHNSVEAVFHVGDEIFGTTDVGAIGVDVAEREMGGVMSEAEGGVN
jgi:hypothetical protein